MKEEHDLELLIASRFPIIAIDTHEEERALELVIVRTRPLSIVMAERVANLRAWALDRTVRAD